MNSLEFLNKYVKDQHYKVRIIDIIEAYERLQFEDGEKFYIILTLNNGNDHACTIKYIIDKTQANRKPLEAVYEEMNNDGVSFISSTLDKMSVHSISESWHEIAPMSYLLNCLNDEYTAYMADAYASAVLIKLR